MRNLLGPFLDDNFVISTDLFISYTQRNLLWRPFGMPDWRVKFCSYCLFLCGNRNRMSLALCFMAKRKVCNVLEKISWERSFVETKNTDSNLFYYSYSFCFIFVKSLSMHSETGVRSWITSVGTTRGSSVSSGFKVYWNRMILHGLSCSKVYLSHLFVSRTSRQEASPCLSIYGIGYPPSLINKLTSHCRCH